MFDAIKNLFSSTSVNYKELVQQGAIILDVRSPSEYSGGHIKGSKNIPVQNLESRLKEIPANKVIITCCASGMRSASARSILLDKGYKEVYNGGGWSSLQSKL